MKLDAVNQGRRCKYFFFFQKSIYVNNQCDTDQFQVWGWRHKDAILSPVITEYFSR